MLVKAKSPVRPVYNATAPPGKPGRALRKKKRRAMGLIDAAKWNARVAFVRPGRNQPTGRGGGNGASQPMVGRRPLGTVPLRVVPVTVGERPGSAPSSNCW